MINDILNNKYIQVALALISGITLGAIFYPTKQIEERIEKQISSEYQGKISTLESKHQSRESEFQAKLEVKEKLHKEYSIEIQQKVDTLLTENKKLSESSKRQFFKLIKPDGTILEKNYEETNREEISSVVTEIREEFNEKIKSTEDKWKTTYRDHLMKAKEQYDNSVASLKEERRIEIEKIRSERIIKSNERKLRVETGYTSDHDIRVGSSYKVWGPISIGTEVDINRDNIRGSATKNSELSINLGFEF
jgi:uncharacterized membrane-anchored protein YhcB (DUF1043 family)